MLTSVFTGSEDAIAVYEELAFAGIDAARDISLRQLMRAPAGMPSLPSPLTQRTHPLRIVDLDRAVKDCFSAEILTSVHNE